jgi:hypothetical protein
MPEPMTLSPKEVETINLLLPVGTRLSSSQLIEKCWGAAQPFNARAIMIGRLRSIGKKLPLTSLGYKIQSTERSGPQPMTFWLENA